MNQREPAPGTDDEFVAMLTSHQSMIHAYLNSVLPGEPDLNDIMQQANLVLWQKRGEFGNIRNFRAWALAIARWEVRAWLTRKRRAAWLVFPEDITELIAKRFEDEPPKPNGEVLDALGRCLEKLKEPERELVLHHYQHEKSLAECSKLYQRSAGSLKVALFRTRQALRRCIDAQLSLHRTQHP